MWRPNGRRTARSGLAKNAEAKCKYQLRCRSKKAVCYDVRPQKASYTPCSQVFCWPVKPAVTRGSGFVINSVLTGNGRFLAGLLTELFFTKMGNVWGRPRKGKRAGWMGVTRHGLVGYMGGAWLGIVSPVDGWCMGGWPGPARNLDLKCIRFFGSLG